MSKDSGGGGGDSEQTIRTEPWGPSQGYLSDALTQARRLYNQQSPGAYPGQTVAEMNPYQTGAIDWMAQRAITGNPLQDLSQLGLAQQIQGVPNPTYGFYGQAMSDPYAGAGQALPYAYGDIGMTRAANPALDMLGQAATGGFLNANPYLDATFADAAQNLGEQYQNYLVPSFEGARIASGRGVSPGEEVDAGKAFYRGQLDEGLAEGLSDLATNIYGGNYARERGLQQAAQQAYGGLYNQGIQQALSATGQLGQLGQAGLAGQLAAAQGMGGQLNQDLTRQLGAIGMAPSLASMDYADIDRLMGAGGALQAQRQAELGGEAQRWQEEMYGPGSPQQWLNDYINRISGIGGMGGTSQQNFESGSGASSGANILSGALGGAGLAELFGLGSFGIGGGPLGGGLAGPTMGMSVPWAIPAAIGGGLLGGLF